MDNNEGKIENEENISEDTTISQDTKASTESENVETVSDEIISSEALEMSQEENELNQNANNMESEKVSNKTSRQWSGVAAVVVLIFMFLMIGAFILYCVFKDIEIGSNADNLSNINYTNISLVSNKKPDVNKEYKDDNGRYTTEGIAEAVRPQIVEILTFAQKDLQTPIGSGSGVIISEDGYIVTNAHVLESADKFLIHTYDDNTYEAQLIGRDTKTDIAVLKVQASGLYAAQLGDSDEVVLGERVVAIGNPAGFAGTLSDGIVSGLNRKIKTDTTGFEMDCIQTNAAISPGNSGGALVNMYGQLIGITSSKYVINSSYEGLGFAITINEAKPIIEELISTGYVSGRVRMGIVFYNASYDYTQMIFKEQFGFDMPEELAGGLWISEISDDCDISNTELAVNDFIIALDGKKVSNYDELYNVINNKRGGDTIKADCIRVNKNGDLKEFTIEFKLMEDKTGNY